MPKINRAKEPDTDTGYLNFAKIDVTLAKLNYDDEQIDEIITLPGARIHHICWSNQTRDNIRIFFTRPATTKKDNADCVLIFEYNGIEVNRISIIKIPEPDIIAWIIKMDTLSRNQDRVFTKRRFVVTLEADKRVHSHDLARSMEHIINLQNEFTEIIQPGSTPIIKHVIVLPTRTRSS